MTHRNSSFKPTPIAGFSAWRDIGFIVCYGGKIEREKSFKSAIVHTQNYVKKKGKVMTDIFKSVPVKWAVWSAIAGAVTLLILGFATDSVMLTSKANKVADEKVTAALVQAYGPVCVRRFIADASAEQRDEFGSTSRWTQDAVIEATGFATPEGYASPIKAVADKCATGVAEAMSAERTKAAIN